MNAWVMMLILFLVMAVCANHFGMKWSTSFAVSGIATATGILTSLIFT